jgi:NitT/TauT family transport system substrate-binding protein
MARIGCTYGRIVALWCVAVITVTLAACSSGADAKGDTPLLRVGVLEYGTVSWEMDTIQRLQLAQKHGIRIKIVPLASESGLAVALQGHEVDLIVRGWLWVARQRANNHDFQFVPYSKAVGAIMVNPASGVKTLADLKGKKFGVAGGPTDKTWLLARAYTEKVDGFDLKDAADPNFAAPPMINHLMLDGRIPAATNYWQYDARLSALGMQPLITIKQMLAGLGIDTVPPLLGWVFSESWADHHRQALQAFFKTTYDAKHILEHANAAWKPLRAKIKPESDAVFAAIRRDYRQGIIHHYGAAQIAAAGQLFNVIAQVSHGQLTGGLTQLPADVFWDGFRLP